MSTNEAKIDEAEDLPPLLNVEEEVEPDEAEVPQLDQELEVPKLEVESETAQLEAQEPVPNLASDQETGATPVATETEAANDDGADLDTVREILLGESLKAVRRELHLTVRNLRGTVKVIHHEFKQRAEELSEQISAVQMAVDNEAVEREELAKTLGEQVQQSGETLQSKLTEQSDAMDLAAKQVHVDVEHAMNEQQHALDALEKKMFAAIDEYTSEFRDGKMNRTELADMLSSLAGKVSSADD